MIIAYILGKYEEKINKGFFSWVEIIEGGIFEFLQRLVLTDLRPQLFHKIKEDKNKYKLLNEWIYKQIEPIISPLGNDFCKKFHKYFIYQTENLNKKVLSAAHFYEKRWGQVHNKGVLTLQV